ncbi:MAG: BACON domain-containing protein, partial [Oscillospiraceae bacterium]|nr:BACON domain-containing protein [Oscillospiraceae bacterium]
MRTLHLKEAYLTSVSQDSWQLTPAERELELEYRSNIPGLEVVIPSSVNWCRLKCVKPKTDPLGGVDSVIVLAVDSLNLGKAERQTTVTVESPFSGMSLTYTITQSPSAEPISFNSLSVKTALISTPRINTNGDDEISYYEASQVNSYETLSLAFGPALTKGTELFSFDEFKYFCGIKLL